MRTAAQRMAPVAAYGAGWAALAAALVSPLHWLGEHLFTFHMIEHEIVMAVAAPLLVMAQPGGTLLWGLPHAARLHIGRAVHRLQGAWRWLTRPGTATLLHGLAVWGWHVPTYFDAALASDTVHRLQHLSFFGTALLFWWSMLRRCAPGVAIWHLFVTMLHTSVLGAWMTLLPRVLYHLQTEGAPAFGLTPLEDQQLAGVIMWVPAETAYAGAALYLAARWIRRSAATALVAAEA
jgi:cytochrome c oxidase assembly factor CtaG